MLANPVRILPNRTIYGEAVERGMKEFPYSFTNVAVWKGDNFHSTTDSVCSDRLMDWNYDRYNACCQEVFGDMKQGFYNRSPEMIEEFLRKFLEINLNLTGIEIACNVSNGYPYWIFYFAKA